MTEVESPNPLRAPISRRGRTQRTRRRTSRFRTGRALGGTLTAWLRNLLPFTILAAIIFAPLLGWELWLFDHPQPWAAGPIDPVWLVLNQVLSFVLTATVVQAVFAQIRGRRMPILGAVTAGLARLPAVVGVSLLISATIAVLVLPPVLFAPALSLEQRISLSLLGTVAMFVLTCGWFVAIPVAVVESPGVVASLRRSWQLTRSLKWQIFVLLIVLNLLRYFAAIVVTGLAGVATGHEFGDLDAATSVWVANGVAALFGSVQAVAEAVVYHELRVEVEGMDEAELAAIFT